jgi:hypothetical protein
MARIRTIKPDFWTDEKIGMMKRDERLLFIGLWNLADDQGVLKSNAAYIRGQLFSYDEELSTATVNAWLKALEEASMIVQFTHNGESYFIVRNFNEHQLINRPSKPKFDKSLINRLLNEGSWNTHGILTEYSQPEGKGKEGKGTGNEEGERKIVPSDFEDNGLSKKVMDFFEFTEIANFDKLREVGNFLKCLFLNEKIKYFEDQFAAYTEYKSINNSYVHSFKKFLGSHDKLFEDGAWNAENWIKKLEVEKLNSNGRIIKGNTGRRSAQTIITGANDDSDL